MKTEKEQKCTYAVLLLFMFLLGALLSLIYLVPIEDEFEYIRDHALFLLLTVLALCCILASSICSRIVFPLLTVFMGCLTAFAADYIKVSLQTGENVISAIGTVLTLIPVYFAVSGWSMCLGAGISRKMAAEIKRFNFSVVFSLAIMFIGSLLLVILVRYILNI